MTRRITFTFDPEKAVQALAYFSKRGIHDLTKLKAAKLLFLADKYHLIHYGRLVTGDRYVCMDYGPVPSKSLDLMNSALAPVEVPDSARTEIEHTLKIDRGFFGTLKNPRFRARASANLDVFSKSDLEALQHVVSEYGGKSARELVKITHLDSAYTTSDANRGPGSATEIPYELFFEDAPEELQEMLELIKEEQENRDAAKALAQ